MPFPFLVSGLTGSPSASWATRYVSVLRQALADTLAAQPGRTVDFLPAIVSGPPHRPILSRPLPRDLAVPRLLQLIHTFWLSHDPSACIPSAHLYGSHSCKSTLLSWGRQLHLPQALRRIQGHRRLSGAHMSVELYGRDDIAPMLEFQRLVLQQVRSGFCPLQPIARGASAPLPDFAVALPPPAPKPVHLQPQPPLLASLVHAEPAPASPHPPVGEVPTTPASTLAEDMVVVDPLLLEGQVVPGDALDSMSSASAPSVASDLDQPAPSDMPALPPLPAPALPHVLYNRRSNVLHAATVSEPCFLSSVGKRIAGDMVHFRPACGSGAMHLSSASVLDSRPPGAQLCLRSACARQLKTLPF